MYRILIVEDDRGITEGVAEGLSTWGMEVRGIVDFRNVQEEIDEYSPHLVLMDISLPYMDGYYWCREIRKTSDVPILFLSSASDNMNIIMAMNMGADDFIAKPFDLHVLIAKIQAILRRTYDFNNERSNALACRGAVLHTEDNSLTFRETKIDLSKNEYRILFILMQNKGAIVSRDKLMEALWETDCFVDDNTLTVNVGRLRKKLGAAGLHDFIVTKFGSGYMVVEEE